MKAQEYFNKYFAELPKTIEEAKANAQNMLVDFSGEVELLLKQRNIKTDDGAVGVIRELNEKWNSVANKVEKKYGKKILKRNIIWNVYLAEIDESKYKRKEEY